MQRTLKNHDLLSRKQDDLKRQTWQHRSGVEFEFSIGATLGQGAASCLAEGRRDWEKDMTCGQQKQGSICGLA
jgi:hypothetical protein